MQTYEVETLPCVKFAHVYHADTYTNDFAQLEDSMEITYISDGSVTIEHDGQTLEAGKGDVIIFPYARARVRLRAAAYHEHHTVFAQLKWTPQPHANGLYLPMITPAAYNTQAARNIIDRLICDPLIFKNSRTRGAWMFLELLGEIDQCNRKQRGSGLSGEALYTQRAKEYVQSHLHRPITQRSVAEYLSISPEYLCYVFKKAEGIPFQKYVNYEKLEAIRNLMQKESAHLYEAAAMFGYNDPNYVSRLFKKYYGYHITDQQNHGSSNTDGG